MLEAAFLQSAFAVVLRPVIPCKFLLIFFIQSQTFLLCQRPERFAEGRWIWLSGRYREIPFDFLYSIATFLVWQRPECFLD